MNAKYVVALIFILQASLSLCTEGAGEEQPELEPYLANMQEKLGRRYENLMQHLTADDSLVYRQLMKGVIIEAMQDHQEDVGRAHSTLRNIYVENIHPRFGPTLRKLINEKLLPLLDKHLPTEGPPAFLNWI